MNLNFYIPMYCYMREREREERERERESINPCICFVFFQSYQAVFPFQSRSDLEVDLTEGEPVYVIEFHDQDGNNEWWLVETNGRRGYAPANYLYKINNN